MVVSFYCLALFLFFTVPLSSAVEEAVTVCGRCLCGDQPATNKNSGVALVNKRFGFDDKKVGTFNDNGTFCITMTVSHICLTNIIPPCMKPELHIYTNCNDKTRTFGIPKLCQRKLKRIIPDKYVNKETFNVGTIQLEMKDKDEDRKCGIKDFIPW